MDIVNKRETITEQYEYDIERFKSFEYSYDEVINIKTEHELSKEEWEKYTNNIDIFITTYNKANEKFNEVTVLFFTNLINNAITGLKALYSKHKEIFVYFDRKRLTEDLKFLNDVYDNFRNDYNISCYYKDSNNDIFLQNKIYEDKYTKRENKLFISNLVDYIYGVEDIFFDTDKLENEDNDVSDDDKKKYAEIIFSTEKNLFINQDVVRHTLLFLTIQLIRMIHLFLKQIDDEELFVLPPTFYAPLFEKEIELFKKKEDEDDFGYYDEVVYDVIYRLEKSKGLNLLTDATFTKVWDYYSNKLEEQELGQLWDKVLNVKGDFARHIFVNGCKFEDFFEFIKCYLALEYLKESKEKFNKGNFNLEKEKPIRKRDKFFVEGERIGNQTVIIIKITDMIMNSCILKHKHSKKEIFDLMSIILRENDKDDIEIKIQKEQLWDDFFNIKTKYVGNGVKLKSFMYILGALSYNQFIIDSPIEIVRKLFPNRTKAEIETLRTYIQTAKSQRDLCRFVKQSISKFKSKLAENQ